MMISTAGDGSRASIAESLRHSADILRADAAGQLPPDSAADRAALIANQGAAADLMQLPDTGQAAVADPYAKLKQRFEMLGRLRGGMEMLKSIGIGSNKAPDAPDWTRLLGDQARAEKELLSRSEVSTWLDGAEARQMSLSEYDLRNLALMRRQWVLTAGLPADLLAEKARLYVEGEKYHLESRGRGAWTQEDVDFIAHNFSIAQRLGAAKMAAMPGVFASPYEALLDDDMPGMRADALMLEFDKLARVLPGMIDEAVALQATVPPPLDLPEVTDFQLETLVRRVAGMIQLDPRRSRIIVGPTHPLSTNTKGGESWLFIRSNPKKFTDTIRFLIHEAHHAKYELGLAGYQPADGHLGQGIHEGMALLGQSLGCASPGFYRWLSIQAQETFELPGDPRLSAENLQRTMEHVERSPIRVNADELTYPLHIVNVRVPLARALLDGSLPASHLEDEWNDLMEEGLGLRPANPAEGSKSDPHWFWLLIPYFESYVVGRAVGVQLYVAVLREHPDLETQIEQGNYAPLSNWLDVNVYKRGSQLTFGELMIASTGQSLNFDHYIDHLSRRFLGRTSTPEIKVERSLNSGGLVPG